MNFRYTVRNSSVPSHFVNRDEIVEWLFENVGGASRWRYSSFRWRFRFKKDYTLFLLRWS